jgi:hypothetical protein
MHHAHMQQTPGCRISNLKQQLNLLRNKMTHENNLSTEWEHTPKLELDSLAHKINTVRAPSDSSLRQEVLNDMKLLNLEEVRRILNIGQWSLNKLINENKLRTVKIGPRRLVSVNALKKYLVSLEKSSIARGNYG